MKSRIEEKRQALETLKRGGILIFPTDTAYGIGCRIDDEEAVARLFKLRRRAETKAVPVLVSSIEMAKDYWTDIPETVEQKLIKPFWPGALTIILPCKTDKVSSLVRGGGDTLGLRMPNHEVLLSILKEVGVPIIGTSANFAGEKTPYRLEDLDQELVKLADFTLRDSSPTAQNDNFGKASTVVDCTVSPWKILRSGATRVNI